MDSTRALTDVFLMFAAARAGGWLLGRLRQPPVIGELLAGILIGPHVIGWLQPMPFHEVLAELGVVFLLFSVGLHTRVHTLASVGKTAALVAVLGVSSLFVMGTGLGRLLGQPAMEALFLGTALAATSAGITARVLADMRRLKTVEARTILGAAVMDDVLGLILVAIVAAIARGKASASEIGLIAFETIGFVAFIAVLGPRMARAGRRHISRDRHPDGPIALSLALCLGLAALAGHIGLAAIIGAFLAGMALAETTGHWDIETRMEPITLFLTPFFFVVMGSHVDPRDLARPATLGLLAAVSAVAILGKWLVCGAAALPLGKRRAAFVGAGMIPRGEVSVIVASMGLALKVVPPPVYSVIVGMTIVTTLVAPPLLKALAPPAKA